MGALSSLSTEQLLQEARDARAYADERYAYFDECRKELLRRHKETGETNLGDDGVVSNLVREAF